MPQSHEAFSGRFAVVPGFIFCRSGLSANARLVFVVLRFHSDKAGRCHPSHARLAEATGLSRRTVARVLGELEKGGLIERTRRISPEGNLNTTLYTLTSSPPPVGVKDEEVVTGRQEGSAAVTQGVVPWWHKGSDGVADEQYQGTEKTVNNTTLPPEFAPEAVASPGDAVSAEDFPHADGAPDLGEEGAGVAAAEGRMPVTPDTGRGAKREGVRRRGEEDRKRDILPENGFGPEAVAALWNEAMPGQGKFLRLLKLTRQRRRKIAARIAEDPEKRASPKWWSALFALVRDDPCLSGEGPPRRGFDEPFTASLPWLVEREERIVRLIERAEARERFERVRERCPYVPVPEGVGVAYGAPTHNAAAVA
jgi:DNA-binding transcriptional ArsR family regulator